jgi:hypothetical protein
LDNTTLENWLWDAACSIRGPLDAPKFKDYILPLLFFKRLSDVYDDEINRISRQLDYDKKSARELAREDRNLVRFYIPEGHTWEEVRGNVNELGQRLTETMRTIGKENPKLEGVIDRRDFNATESGQRILDDGTLARLMERMQLSTLHSFAAPLLHRYAAFSPLPRGFRILDWTTERGCAHRDVINLISAQIVHLGSIIR